MRLISFIVNVLAIAVLVHYYSVKWYVALITVGLTVVVNYIHGATTGYN